MEIDLFTLVAQIINLIILLFLLRKFLYLPVLKAVEARQTAIAEELKAAEDAREKAHQAELVNVRNMKKLESQKQKILLKAGEDAEKLSAELSAKALEEYKAAKQQWLNKMFAEQSNFEQTMQKAVTEQFNRFTRKAFEQIADADIDALAAKKLMVKIAELPEEVNAEYAASFSHKKSIHIKSAHELSAKIKTQLEDFLHKNWHLRIDVQFIYEIHPELCGGLCIEAGEQLVAWNFNAYLNEFRNGLNQASQQFLNRGEK